jgi:hypothetical protein
MNNQGLEDDDTQGLEDDDTQGLEDNDNRDPEDDDERKRSWQGYYYYDDLIVVVILLEILIVTRAHRPFGDRSAVRGEVGCSWIGRPFKASQ